MYQINLVSFKNHDVWPSYAPGQNDQNSAQIPIILLLVYHYEKYWLFCLLFDFDFWGCYGGKLYGYAVCAATKERKCLGA